MIVRVETPDGDRGQVCGFTFATGFWVLVAIEGKSGNGKLEVHAPEDLIVRVVEPEYGE